MITFSQDEIFWIFFLGGMFSFLKSMSRARRFYYYQRDIWLLADSAQNFLMALALLGWAMRRGTEPLPLVQTDRFRNLTVLVWLLSFVPLIVGQLFDWYSQVKIEKERREP